MKLIFLFCSLQAWIL